MGDLNSGTRLYGERLPSKGHLRIVSALADLGLVSAYHKFHRFEHGHEAHRTYRHNSKASQPWHIDFCFVPANWVDRLVSVEVMDGEDWTARSDHNPLRVDLRLPRLLEPFPLAQNGCRSDSRDSAPQRQGGDWQFQHARRL
jgi:endonuclease/exonuclease/phosphatase family metal-dependent hydrolase